MEHTKHLWRAGLLVIALAFAMLIGRHFMVPETFGDEGYYRAASRLEFMAQPLVHGGPGACAECHEKQQGDHDGGKHATVPCEVCHAPVVDHVKDGVKIEGEANKMPANPSMRLCNLCHLHLAARPRTGFRDGGSKPFPQIVPLEHLLAVGAIDPGEPVPDGSCVLCHSVHKPDLED